MAVIHQQGTIRLDTDEYRDAIVTMVNSGDNVNLVALSNGYAWGDGHAGSMGTQVYTNIDIGTGIGEWQPGTQVSDEIATAIATACVLPVAGSSPTRAKDTTFTPSADYDGRPVRVAVSGTLSCTSTLLASQTAAIELRSDSGATPATPRAVQSFTLAGIAATLTVPFFMSYDVPAGDAVKFVTSGAGTVTIAHVNETPQ